MEQSTLTIIALALLLSALSSMEEETCVITATRIVVDERDNSIDPSHLQFILQGVSVGGAPTHFTWRKDGVVLLSNSFYTIEEPVLTNNENPCSNRSYCSKITAVDRVTGIFTYTVSNAESGNDLVVLITVEAIVNNVVVTVLTDTSARVSWDRLPISDIKKYLIRYKQTENRNTQATEFLIAVPSTEVSVYITGLVAGAEYQFQVAAQTVVEGEIVLGQISLTISTSMFDDIIATTPLQPYNFNPHTSCTDTTLVAITAVAVFIASIVLYTIFLMLVLMVLHCYRKSKRSKMDLNKDPAYEHVSDFQQLAPETEAPADVYDYISNETVVQEVIYDAI